MIMQKRAMNTSVSSTEEDIRLQAVYEYMNIPPRLAEATLINYKPGGREQERALQQCRAFAKKGLENIDRGRGLFIQGPVGTGKSHLSIATLRAVVEKNPGNFGRPPSPCNFFDEPLYEGYFCSIISVVDLLDRLRESFREDRLRESNREDQVWVQTRELLHRCRRDEAVIMDDIGAQKPSDWVEEQLFSLIDLRYRMQRTTIFTTNCTLKQLENQIGYRCVSRIMEMCEGVRVGGEDWRKTHMAD